MSGVHLDGRHSISTCPFTSAFCSDLTFQLPSHPPIRPLQHSATATDSVAGSAIPQHCCQVVHHKRCLIRFARTRNRIPGRLTMLPLPSSTWQSSEPLSSRVYGCCTISPRSYQCFKHSDASMICSCMRLRSGVISVSPAQVEGN